MYFERRNAFQNAHNYIFIQKKMLYVCLPYLIFSDPFPETHLFFYLAYTVLNNTTLPYVLTKINVQINCDLMIIYFKDLVLICTQWNLHKLFKHLYLQVEALSTILDIIVNGREK